jgi:hypothetical protein
VAAEAAAPARTDPSSWWTRPLRAPSLHSHTIVFGILLLVLVLVLFRDALLRGRVFFHRDVQLMWHTQVETFVRAVTAGEWPVWNPFIGFGQPLWADANTQVLYPPTWLHLLVRPWTYYKAYVAAHLVFAGAGLFALARRLGLGRAAAGTAALLWVASGPLLSAVDMWNQLAGAAWMPWAGLAAVSALSTGRRRWAVAWGIAQAAQVVAGSLEAALMTAVGVAAYALVMRPWRDGGVSSRRIVALGGLALATAVGLSAAQWAPSIEVAARSSRAHLPAQARTFWSVHPAGLLQVSLPLRLHELRLRPEMRDALFDGPEPFFLSLHLGLPSIALVTAALVGRRRACALLAGAFALALLVALGRYTPVYDLVAALVPPVRALRYPAKAMLAAALCWALLAGFGFEAWSGHTAIARRRWLLLVMAPVGLLTILCGGLALLLAIRPERVGPSFLAAPEPRSYKQVLSGAVPGLATAAAAGGFVALLAAARRRRWERASGPLALATSFVSVVQLAVAHDGLSPTAPRDLYAIRPPVLSALDRPDHRRIYVYDYNVPGKSRFYLGRDFPYAVTRGPAGWSYAATQALAMRLAVFPPVAGGWGIPGSFDHDTSGIGPRFLADLSEVLLATEGTPAHLRLLQLGAVTEEVALHSAGLQSLLPVTTADALMDEPVRVFAVPDPRPRAYVVGGARIAGSDPAIGLLLDPAFDASREIVLPAGTAVPVDPAFRGNAAITLLGTDRAGLEVDLSAPGYVVMVDAFDPAWKARVDGHEAEVLRANVGFRAVPVPAGRHSVQLRYRPRALLIGLALTAASVLGLALAAVAAWRRGEAAAS